MVQALMIMGGLGVVIGVVLAVASKIFYVYVDPKIEEVEGALPGANCGGCGLPGCSANAKAIVEGKSSPGSCVAAGPEVAQTIASIMGVSAEAKEPEIALPGCTYGVKDAETKFIYNGVDDCRAAAVIAGGMKVCSIGCIGLGSCAKSCPFNALGMGPQGLPVVDEKKCTGCGTCERVCPKKIIRLTSITRRILLEYTTNDCTTPCQRACPAGINIREYIRQISLKDYNRAVQIIKERNPFPTVIGRICPRFCEFDCRRKMVDEPVAINFLKRFASDYEKQAGQRILPFKAPESGRKIAVIGGGVEGLSTAFFSARLGHDATVFEATKKLGGLLRSAISRLRLPQTILDWDVDGILEMGVKANTGKSLGKDFYLHDLFKQGFEAVFLASGGWDSRLARGVIETSELTLPGTYLLIDVIKAAQKDLKNISFKKDAVIIGGGKAALKACAILKAQGAANVAIIFRETYDEIIAVIGSADELKQEGVNIYFNSAATRLFGEKNNLTGIELIDLQTNKKAIISAGHMILSSGRLPEIIFTKSKYEGEIISDDMFKWEAQFPYKDPVISDDEKGMFAKKDALSDFSASIKAIAAGRRGAACLHQILYGIDIHLPEDVLMPESVIQDVDGVKNVKPFPRQIMPICNESDLSFCEEIEKGFEEKAAVLEADRCLRCGLICYKDVSTVINDKIAATGR